MSDSSNNALETEIQALTRQMESAQAAISTAQAEVLRTSARLADLLHQVGAPDPETAAIDRSQDPFEQNDAFQESPPAPDCHLQRHSATGRETEERDFYVELPFIDPYDCFEEPEPSHGFPASMPNRLEAQMDLGELFSMDPDSQTPADPAPQRGSARKPDIEIEYLEGGGYRLRSTPGKEKLDPSGDGLSS